MADILTTFTRVQVCTLCGEPTDRPHTDDNCPRAGREPNPGPPFPLPPLNLERDSSPIESDYDDIQKLFVDMRETADEHPDWLFLSADDPGLTYDPPRVPRLGWTAFPPDDDTSKGKQWTIKLSTIKRQLDQVGTSLAIRRGLQSAAGRQKLIETIIGRRGHPSLLGERWTLEEVVVMVREIAEPLQRAGWGVGLTGSVLIKGESDNDVDLIVYPLDSTEVSYGKLREALGVCGMELKHDVEVVHKAWRRSESRDCKHVEVWHTSMGRRVDLFILG